MTRIWTVMVEGQPFAFNYIFHFLCRTYIILNIFLLSWGSLGFTLDDKILAVVNNEVITARDIREYLTAKYLQLISEGKNEEQIKEAMHFFEEESLIHVINDKLILDLANQKGLTIRNKIVDDRIENIKSRYPSEQEFHQSLIKDGMTLSDLKNKITNQVKVKYMVDLEVRDKIIINPQDVNNYYEKHMDEFRKPERVNLDSIFIPYKENPEDARLKATEALNLLKEGKDFKEVAKQYSQASAIGIVARNQLLPALEETIFNLKVGKISALIEVENGIYIFQALEKFPSEQTPLEKVNDLIYARLFEEKFSAQLQKWLTKLQEEAYVEIKD